MTIAVDSIRFACPSCQQVHRVPATFSGKKGGCSRCKTVLRVREGVAELYVSRKRRSGSGSGSGSEQLRLTRQATPELEGDDDYAWSSDNVSRANSRRHRSKPSSAFKRPLVIGVLALCASSLAVAATGIALSLTGSSDALAAMPESMDVIVQVDYQRAIETLELVSVLEQQYAANPELPFDPVEDIERIYLAMDLTEAQGATDGEGVLIFVQGDFDLYALKGAVEEAAMKLEPREHSGVTYLVAQGLPQPFSLCALESDLLAFGTERMIQDAIDTHAGTRPSVRDNGDVAYLADSVQESLIWCAVSVPLDDPIAAELKGLRTLVLSADHQGSELSVTSSLRFTNPDAAEEIETAVNEALSNAEQSLGATALPVDVETLRKAFSSEPTVSRDGKTLTLELAIDTDRAFDTAGLSR